MWEEGKLIIDGEVFEYEIKVFEEPSEFGINKGRISKLELSYVDNAGQKFVTALYDRKWLFKPKMEITKKAVEEILLKWRK